MLPVPDISPIRIFTSDVYVVLEFWKCPFTVTHSLIVRHSIGFSTDWTFQVNRSPNCLLVTKWPAITHISSEVPRLWNADIPSNLIYCCMRQSQIVSPHVINDLLFTTYQLTTIWLMHVWNVIAITGLCTMYCFYFILGRTSLQWESPMILYNHY